MKKKIFEALYFIGACALAGMCLVGTYTWIKKATEDLFN